MRNIQRTPRCGIGNGALAMVAPAFAQDTSVQNMPPGTEQVQVDDKDESIVVTGTLIHGIILAGANVIGIDAEATVESEASSANGILDVPQIANFLNALPDARAGNPSGARFSPISRPNLRGLPRVDSDTRALTLVVLDGHRVTPGGTR